ncbi:hypothetical protein WCLP8_5240004 [uncultured Gammaproteobacteria bacterium]
MYFVDHLGLTRFWGQAMLFEALLTLILLPELVRGAGCGPGRSVLVDIKRVPFLTGRW